MSWDKSLTQGMIYHHLSIIGITTLVGEYVTHGDEAPLWGFCEGTSKHRDLKRAMMMACTGGSIECVKIVYNRYMSLKLTMMCKQPTVKPEDAPFIEGYKKACMAGHIDVVKYLHEHCTNPNTGMEGACEHGRAEVVKYLIEHKADQFHRPMHIAARYGHESVTSLLLETGKIHDDSIVLAIWEATRHHHVDVVAQMLKYPGARDEAFKSACRYGHIDLVNALADNKMNWNNGMVQACCGGYLEIVQLAIENHAHAYIRGLYWAGWGGNRSVVDFMLECTPIDNLDICLEGAVSGGQYAIVQYLVGLGASNYQQALSAACGAGDHADYALIIELLRDRGGNGMICTKCNQTADLH